MFSLGVPWCVVAGCQRNDLAGGALQQEDAVAHQLNGTQDLHLTDPGVLYSQSPTLRRSGQQVSQGLGSIKASGEELGRDRMQVGCQLSQVPCVQSLGPRQVPRRRARG